MHKEEEKKKILSEIIEKFQEATGKKQTVPIIVATRIIKVLFEDSEPENSTELSFEEHESQVRDLVQQNSRDMKAIDEVEFLKAAIEILFENAEH